MKNTHIITRDIRVGKSAAEEDDLLEDCFISNQALSDVLNLSSNASILSGRTGSGKSAIIKHIKDTQEKTSLIPLEEISMTHMSNSDILRFLRDIGADLNILFQTIWKHILLIEYIRLKYRIKNEDNSKKWFADLFSSFQRDKTKKRALDYLERYQNSLWIEMDENIRQIVGYYEKEINTALGIDIARFSTKAGYAVNMSQQQKSELVARVRKIINPEQLQDLSRIIDMLASRSEEAKDKYYILLDRLDARWVDDSIKYRLINALVEALQKFRPIRNLKIIVALRTDIIEKSIQENDDIGFQREKFRDFIIEIEWDQQSLKKLLNKRISTIFKRKYSPKNQVSFEDIFQSQINQQGAFDYIVERTLLRPRDIISFVNECFRQSEQKATIQQKDIKEAEADYSRLRYEALIDEWRNAYPTLDVAMSILKGKAPSFNIKEISSSEVEDLLCEITNVQNAQQDPIYQKAMAIFEDINELEKINFLKVVFSVLYRVGAVGVKLMSSEAVQYNYRNRPLIDKRDIDDRLPIRVVKMLYRYLNINLHNNKGKNIL